MKTKSTYTWWQAIVYCLAFLLIFLLMATLSDIASKWIGNRTYRFAFRELVLRLPLTLYFMHLFAKKVLKRDKSSFSLGNLKFGILKWFITGVLISLAFGTLILFFNDYTYLLKLDQVESRWFVYYIVSTIIMAINGGVIEETLFRGYILGILKEKWNVKVAVIIPSILFGAMHLTMLESFNITDFIMILVGGSMVGIMFSLIVIKTGSVYAASVVHMIWNLFFAGRIIKMSTLPLEKINSIFAFQLNSKNILLNGGNFGIEVSLIAISVYIYVSLILIWFIKTTKK